MKKVYEAPLLEIEKFIVGNHVITTSNGTGDNGEYISLDEFANEVTREF